MCFNASEFYTVDIKLKKKKNQNFPCSWTADKTEVLPILKLQSN